MGGHKIQMWNNLLWAPKQTSTRCGNHLLSTECIWSYALEVGGKKKELVKLLQVTMLSKRDRAKYTSGINWVPNRNTHYVLRKVQKNVWVMDSHRVGAQNLGRLCIWVGYYRISRLLAENRERNVTIWGLEHMGKPNTSSQDTTKDIYRHLYVNSKLWIFSQR